MDETTVPILAPGKGKTSTSYLFAIHRDDRSFGGNQPPIVLYCPSRTRAMYKIHELLNGVTAIVQTVAYAGYGQLGREGTSVEGIISPKCWAHTRRHFTDEYEFNKTEDARIVIRMIADLYAEEDKIRGKPPMVRQAHRRKYSVPILARLKVFLDECSAFAHFFPFPTQDDHVVENLAKNVPAVVRYDPDVRVIATNGKRRWENVNRIGPIPKGCDIRFEVIDPQALPEGSIVYWTVRNEGAEAEAINDLGHIAGTGFSNSENSAYRGGHFMDVVVKLNGRIIGRRRVSVQISGLGIPKRNPERPAWLKHRGRR